ncbi:MRPL36 54S ribosomal protein L36 [Candida maltosa Xu316]
MRKIKLGKARPAIFYQFDTLVELSDGSVITRKSQAPKDEIRMISDQRNSLAWNPHRSDLSGADLNATGKIGKFKSRFSAFEAQEEQPEEEAAEEEVTEKKEMTHEQEEALRAKQKAQAKAKDDELFALMGENAEELVGGGKLYDRKADKKRFKK